MRPDLVISDGLMPRMDGFSLCRAWMSDGDLARVPFIFYSGSYPRESDRQFGLGIGASGYFTKSTPIDTVIAAVEGRLAAASPRPEASAIGADDFEEAHRELVTEKLDAKLDELRALSAAYEGQREGYRRLFSANPQPMWIYDTQSLRFLTVNEAAVRLYGYTAEEWLRMTFLDILPQGDHARLRRRIAPDVVTALVDAETWTHVRKDGSSIQVEISAHPLAFEGRPARVVMALDVTRRIRAEAREQEHLRRIEEAMRGTIDVVTRLVELRDPYTVGHERRTAALCQAIGRKLGLQEDRLEGLFIAALVHDIGKVSIPVEILAKPGRLNALERAYIEAHPDTGYQLLQSVPFGWPVAEMVRQHHERLDGSGYPRGLAGDQILLEARIIAVADTVEAMASHRPYRPALSLDASLAEIGQHAGTRYDSDVVAACLELFRADGYVLPKD